MCHSHLFLTVDARQSLKHRQVKHYGYEFLYGTNNVNLDHPLKCGIPSECDNIIDQLISDGHVNTKPDQLTVNKYEPGQGKHAKIMCIAQ